MDLSAGRGFEAVSWLRYNWWKQPWSLATRTLKQLRKLVTDSFYFQDIHKPSAHGDVAEWRVSASGPVNIFMAAFRKPPLKIQALTSSIDWDHRHTKPTALQNNKDVYSSLEHIFTNQTSIFLILKFWYDITGETFCIHQSQMRLTIIYGHIFPERLSHKQSENIC